MPKQAKPKLEEFEYRAEMKQLLHLIVHSLYTHPEIFLRELISNSSDALNKIRFRALTDKNILSPEAPLQIKIELDDKKKSFSIEDTGMGMTREELINEIGTVAHSGTLEFLQQVQKEKKALDGNLIGQFGVGFYSVFMVTDEVLLKPGIPIRIPKATAGNPAVRENTVLRKLTEKNAVPKFHLP